MSRHLRRVPANWERPKRYEGSDRYQPKYDGDYETEMQEWLDGRALWKAGTHPDQSEHETAKECTWEDWHGRAPDPDYYRPAWTDDERTHFQMYEDCSEGTPISPVFATPEACARWCADNGASAFGGQTAPYEWWLRVCEGSAGFGLMVGGGKMELI